MSDARSARRAGLRPNNFDLIRLVAALQVVLIHSTEHLRIELPGLAAPIGWFPGVPIFFVLSGFLVSLSYERNPDLRTYAANRLLRILPGLWVCFLASVASVLWIRPDLLAGAASAEFAGWTAAQLTIGQFFNPSFLRDYGVGALNGSLWTIPVEMQFYALVPILYVALGLHRSRSRGLIAAILAALVVNRLFVGWRGASDALSTKLLGVTFVPHVWCFLVGVYVQRNFGRLRPLFAGKATWWVAAHLGLCAFLKQFDCRVEGNLIGPLPSLTLIGVTFSLAYSAPALSDRWLRHNDVSYGTYLYHMIVVNALIELQWPRTMTTVLTIFVLTICCAVVSWSFVERPALAWKRLFSRPVIPTFEVELGQELPQSQSGEATQRLDTPVHDASGQAVAV